jgi:hypothetical protein
MTIQEFHNTPTLQYFYNKLGVELTTHEKENIIKIRLQYEQNLTNACGCMADETYIAFAEAEEKKSLKRELDYYFYVTFGVYLQDTEINMLLNIVSADNFIEFQELI